jgi:NAD(P)-dependent dehydrogenase (short-subunit alcohol dehydrogenase family)
MNNLLLNPFKMSNRLANKVAVITGSSSGLGRAIAHAFAAEGARICCVDLYPSLRNPINPKTGKAEEIHNRAETGTATDESLREKHGGKHFFIKTDVTSAVDVEAAVENCVAKFGRLDILVCCAGISVESTHVRAMRVHETEESDYDKTMAVNAKGVFMCCKYGIRQMLRQDQLEGEKGDRGWIVNIASVQAMVGYWGTRMSAPILTRLVTSFHPPGLLSQHNLLNRCLTDNKF